MAWLGRWLWSWAGRWLGYELDDQEQQQPEAAPYTRYGRIIRAASDRLFSFREGDLSCEISDGAVILQRQPTDDYVRFRLPDTWCPPLPEPDTPLDDGHSDVAEPERWLWGGNPDYFGPGWQFGPHWHSSLLYVSPNYKCYDGNFLTRITAAAGATGMQYPIYYICGHFRFVVYTSALQAGIGFGSYLRPVGDGFAVNISAITPNGYVPYNLFVSLGVPIYLFIRRTNGTISVGWSVTNPNAPDPSTEVDVVHGVFGLVGLALGMDFNVPQSDPPLPPAAALSAGVTEWRTIYGGPSEVWVRTPVVDLGRPLQVQVRVHPSRWLQISWRASNTPFGRNDSSPSWNNPEGEYRYWQARFAWRNPHVLLERVEFVVVSQQVVFEIPCATRALFVHHARGIFSRGNAKGIVSIDRSSSTGGSYDIGAERVLTVDW